MEPLPFFCTGQTLIPARSEVHGEITASTPLPVWECSVSRTFCTAVSNLAWDDSEIGSLSIFTALCSAPSNLGKLLCFGMQIPNFYPAIPVPDGLHGQLNIFQGIHSWLTSSHPWICWSSRRGWSRAPNTCQGWGRRDQPQEQGMGAQEFSWRCVDVSAGWAQFHIQPLRMRVWRNGKEIWTEHPNDITSTVESRA